MPYYIKCEIEGCETLMPDTGQKIHICMSCRERLKLPLFDVGDKNG